MSGLSALERLSSNRARFGALLLLYGLSMLGLDRLGGGILTLVIPTTGLALLYALEKWGRFTLFEGMTLPVLMIGVTSCTYIFAKLEGLEWVMNSALIAVIVSLVFAGVRLSSYESSPRFEAEPE